jgi:hypothetical protein
MGCDIHLTVEKQAKNGKWYAVNLFNAHHQSPWRVQKKKVNWIDTWSSPVARSRNYDRFAALAGVRGHGPKPRGLPNDVSESTRFAVEKWGPDGHSHSWLPLKDAVKIFFDTEYDENKKEGYVKNSPEYYFFGVDRVTEDPEELDQYRVVFWFDN